MRIRVLVSLLLLLAVAAAPGATRAEPAALPPEEQAVLQELFTLGRSLAETRAEAEEVGEEIAVLTARHAEVAAERDRLEAKRQQRLASFGRRLRFYQEHGRVAPLAVLLGANSFVDFLSRWDLVSQVLRRDVALMQELRSLTEAVRRTEAELVAAAEQLTALRKSLAAREAQVQAEIARREAVLAALQERRAAVEAQLAEVERAWQEQGEPLLRALGTALTQLDPSQFEPDQITLSLFPPGAMATISSTTLDRFFGQVPALKGLHFVLEKGAVGMEGEFAGARVRVGGRFVVAGKTTLRYEPTEIQVQAFTVPSAAIGRLLAESQMEIDVSRMITPWALKAVEMQEGELRIKAGIK